MEEPAATSRAVRAVEEAARAAELPIVVVQHAETTRTAEDAAAAIGCDVAQIVKSLVFSVGAAGGEPGEAVLALVSGENQLDERRLARAAGAGGRAKRVEADMVRAVTGFAIGGVPPFGHTTRLRCFVDRDLLRYDVVWAAAGTPHAVFAVPPLDLVRAAGGEVADLRRG
jgi:prolyl-tRNA editing enzyme YbaK/EbsC (Cys-tRNA(Pro) deacylase)